MSIRSMIMKLINGPKADSDSYIAYLKKKGYKIGDRCKIYVPSKTSIDEPCFMLEIGNDVRITEGVTILCHDASVYTLDNAARNGGEYYSSPRAYKKTTIGNNVFIGRYAILTMGTHVGDNVIIGAGAVCHGTLESDSVYAGNPARKICGLEQYNNKCAVQYIRSAQEYFGEFYKHFGRMPDLNEIYAGFMPLFGGDYPGYVKGDKFPVFSSISELMKYENT